MEIRWNYSDADKSQKSIQREGEIISYNRKGINRS